jgi:hypothetical protein
LSRITAEIDAIGLKIYGKLREPNRPIPVIRAYVDIHKHVRRQAWRHGESQVVDRISDAEMAQDAWSARCNPNRHRLGRRSKRGLASLDLVVQPELQLVGMKIDLNRREKLPANYAVVEQPAQQVNLVEGVIGVDTSRAFLCGVLVI